VKTSLKFATFHAFERFKILLSVIKLMVHFSCWHIPSHLQIVYLQQTNDASINMNLDVPTI